jgi:hypothetical protein
MVKTEHGKVRRMIELLLNPTKIEDWPDKSLYMCDLKAIVVIR